LHSTIQAVRARGVGGWGKICLAIGHAIVADIASAHAPGELGKCFDKAADFAALKRKVSPWPWNRLRNQDG
jgi:hypothetical protein